MLGTEFILNVRHHIYHQRQSYKHVKETFGGGISILDTKSTYMFLLTL